MKRFDVWFPTLMILACIVGGIVSVVSKCWVNLFTFTMVGITFGLHLHLGIKGGGRA